VVLLALAADNEAGWLTLWCEGSDAIGAKRTCRERQERVDLTKMTEPTSLHCSTLTLASR